MGYRIYDFFEDHLKGAEDFDSFLEALCKNDERWASDFMSSILYQVCHENFGLDSAEVIHRVLETMFDEKQVMFILNDLYNHNFQMIGRLPKGVKLTLENHEVDS